jgi:hypothetical protein
LLIAKGFRCRFFLEEGGSRRGAVLLHDEDGEAWPYTSGLIVPSFRRLGEPCDDRAAQRYYGDDYPLKEGVVTLPPRDLRRWEAVGPVNVAHYDRRGDVEPGPKEHEFGAGYSLFRALGGGALPVLYKLGPNMRLELGNGAVWNWRGIVRP